MAKKADSAGSMVGSANFSGHCTKCYNVKRSSLQEGLLQTSDDSHQFLELLRI